MSLKRPLFLLMFLIIYSINPTICFALDPSSTGVVLLHGKGSEPIGLKSLASALTTAGFSVETPELPWSKNRNYDQPYEEADIEIAGAIATLKAKGVRQIVLAGHSLGAAAALHNAVTDNGIIALVLIAPAHFPEGDTALKLAGKSVAEARQIVNSKNANQISDFVEVPSGRLLTLPASIYLSYYDPQGPSAMSLFAHEVKIKNIAWFAASSDPATDKFSTLVVPNLPSNIQLNRIDIISDHAHSPDIAKDIVVDWLKALQ